MHTTVGGWGLTSIVCTFLYNRLQAATQEREREREREREKEKRYGTKDEEEEEVI